MTNDRLITIRDLLLALGVVLLAVVLMVALIMFVELFGGLPG